MKKLNKPPAPNMNSMEAFLPQVKFMQMQMQMQRTNLQIMLFNGRSRGKLSQTGLLAVASSEEGHNE